MALLDWAGDAGAAVIPFGGGSSVVGGVEPAVGEGWRGTVSLDLSRLDRVLEIDRASRAARIQAGILGPALEAALKPEGLTLRHFPQSFEFSTLGGWIATRSGGHFATLYTHIDDFVESLRVVTPSGTVATRRLPGSGAGPSPDRLFIGSEGALGIITEAWMRLQHRPRHRASLAVAFDEFHRAAEAVRVIAQAGLFRPTSACSMPWRRPSPVPATAATPSSCWGSNRPTTRSRRGSTAASRSAPSSAAASTGKPPPEPRAPGAPAPPAPGARRSSACPTTAKSWCPPA